MLDNFVPWNELERIRYGHDVGYPEATASDDDQAKLTQTRERGVAVSEP